MRNPLAKVRSFWFTLGSLVHAYLTTNPRNNLFEEHRPLTSSGNAALAPNLTTLTAQCRHLDRNTCEARGVSEGGKADLVGSGISVRPLTGDAALDLEILAEFLAWAEHALVNGISLWEWQALQVGELTTAGNGLTRIVVLPERLEKGLLPIALLPLEIEWLCEQPVAELAPGNIFIRGIECTPLMVPQFYHLRNPDTAVTRGGERVAAAEMIHVFELRRAQAVLGEPFLTPAIGRVWQDDKLVTTELDAAQVTAAPAITISSTQPSSGGLARTPDPKNPGKTRIDIPRGSVVELPTGKTATVMENKRPSQQIMPFRKGIRGDIAAACRVSQFWLDRDSANANYSSMRMDQLLTKRQHAMLKVMLGRTAAGQVYEAVLPWILILLGEKIPANPRARAKLFSYETRPDQPEYVDPEKDIAASVNAIVNNLSSYDIELSARGKDRDRLFLEIAREKKQMEQLGLSWPLPQTKAAPASHTAGQAPAPVAPSNTEAEAANV